MGNIIQGLSVISNYWAVTIILYRLENAVEDPINSTLKTLLPVWIRSKMLRISLVSPTAYSYPQ